MITTKSRKKSTNDHEYCAELARRSAARAALHLGIENMSCDALDVIGDALLVYLERLSQSISRAVESSGRTSAHSNVLDALRAIERCTAPAAYQVACDTKAAAAAAANAATTGKENGNLTAPGTIHSSSGDVTNGVGPPPQPVGIGQLDRSWESLATFCFGANWIHLCPKEEEEEQKEQTTDQAVGAATTNPHVPNNGAAATANGTANPLNGGTTILNGAISGPASVKPATTTSVNATTGGKTAPTLHPTNNNGLNRTKNANSNPSSLNGWNAPYLDDIPPFPLLPSSSHSKKNGEFNNPSNRTFFSNLVGYKLHSLASGEEACCDFISCEGGVHVHSALPTSKSQKKGNDEDNKDDDDDDEEKAMKQKALLAEERAIASTKKVPDEFYWGTVLSMATNNSLQHMENSNGGGGSDKKDDSSNDKDQDIDMKDAKDDKNSAGGGTDGVGSGAKGGDNEPPTKRIKTDSSAASSSTDKNASKTEKDDASKKEKDGKKITGDSNKKDDGNSNNNKGNSSSNSGTKNDSSSANSKKRKAASSSPGGTGKDTNDSNTNHTSDTKNKSVSFAASSSLSNPFNIQNEGGRGRRHYSQKRKPAYVPIFYPPFPPENTYIGGGMMSVPPVPPPGPDIPEGTAAATSSAGGPSQHISRKDGVSPTSATQVNSDIARQAVRSSLVHLGGSSVIGSSYWGSGWDNMDEEEEDPSQKKKGGKGLTDIASIYVRSGRPGGIVSSSAAGKLSSVAGAAGAVTGVDRTKSVAPGSKVQGGTNAAGLPGGKATTATTSVVPTVSASVVPLTRESNSRTSRILEGSMDAYQ